MFAFIEYDFSAVEQKYLGSSNPVSPWSPYYGVTPTRAEAKSAAEVRTLVCIRQIRFQIGVYEPGDVAAVRDDWDIRLLNWPGGEPIAASSFQGADPPPETQVSTGDYVRTGGEPSSAGYAWIDGLIEK